MGDASGGRGATIVVPLPGEIDMANADRVGEELLAAFGPGVGTVIADMSGTRFCDTSGVHALVMAAQVLIGVYGFYAIRTFEKYTVPPTFAIMLLMSILAWTRPGVVNWGLTTSLPAGAIVA